MTQPTSGEEPPDDRFDVDRRFNEIIADYGPTPPVDALPGAPSGAPRAAEGGQDGPPAGGDRADNLPVEDPAEDEGHFVPAPPDPLPAGDLHFWGIVVGLTVGPLLVLLSAALPAVGGVPYGAVGVVVTTAGFVLLVLRSPRRSSGDDDSGARV